MENLFSNFDHTLITFPNLKKYLAIPIHCTWKSWFVVYIFHKWIKCRFKNLTSLCILIKYQNWECCGLNVFLECVLICNPKNFCVIFYSLAYIALPLHLCTPNLSLFIAFERYLFFMIHFSSLYSITMLMCTKKFVLLFYQILEYLSLNPTHNLPNKNRAEYPARLFTVS